MDFFVENYLSSFIELATWANGIPIILSFRHFDFFSLAVFLELVSP